MADSRARTATMLKRFAAAVVVGLIAAVALSFWAFKLKGVADQQSVIAGQKADEAEAAMGKAMKAQGMTSLAVARAAVQEGRHFDARLHAARALGFEGFGAERQDSAFRELFPPLLPEDAPEFSEALSVARAVDGASPLWVVPYFRHHLGSVNDVAIAPDGRIAASGGENSNEVHIWDLESGDLVRKLEGHTEDVEAVVFSPDGETLVFTALGKTHCVCAQVLKELAWLLAENAQTPVAGTTKWVHQAISSTFARATAKACLTRFPPWTHYGIF